MSEHQKSEMDERTLDGWLREWRVAGAPLPPRFQADVWRRIEAAEGRARAGVGNRLLTLLNESLPRPRVAFAYLAALLVAGAAAGSLTAQRQAGHWTSELSERYVQSIDPYRPSLGLP